MRTRNPNTLKLVKNRPRPELPRWYDVEDAGTNMTYFSMKDAPDYEGMFWEELNYYQEDKDRINQELKDKVNVTDAVCSQLRLNDRIREKAKELVRDVDGRKMNDIGGLRAVAMGAIAYADNTVRQRISDFEYGDRIQNEEEFRRLGEKLGVEVTEAVTRFCRIQNGAV